MILAGAAGPGALPLVLVLHGLGETPAQVEGYAGWDQLATRKGFRVAYPRAARRDGEWNQAPAVLGSTPDDSTYLAKLLQRLVRAGCADPHRVYVSGLSNGGGMAYRLACDHADLVAGLILVSADYLGSDVCARRLAVPVIAFHGTADAKVPLGGVTYGTSVHPPVESWARGWAIRNGCGRNPFRGGVTGGVLLTWPCPAGGQVLLYEITGGTHAWFHSPVDATVLGWTFIAKERR